MTSVLKDPIRVVTRRRQRYYVFAAITSIGLMVAGIMGFMLEGATELGYSSLQSSILLTFAVLLLFLVPTRDMRRAESIVRLASESGGTLRIEDIYSKLGIPNEKSKALLEWMLKQKIVEKKEATNRWVFPFYRRK